MNRLLVALGLVLLTGAALAVNASWAEDDKDVSIKAIMAKAHKGGDALLSKLDKAVKSDAADWDVIQKQSKELVDLGTALGKATPPKGEKASWEKLTKSYVDTAKDLDEAAKKKDKTTAGADLKKLRGSCSGCHKAHKS
jgi:hypothetical protein